MPLSNSGRKCIVFEQWSSSWKFTVANEIDLDIYGDRLSSTTYLLLALLTLFVYVCILWCQTHIVLGFCFLLFFVCSFLCLSLSCVLCNQFRQFLWIAPSVFSNVYLIRITIILFMTNLNCFMTNLDYLMLSQKLMHPAKEYPFEKRPITVGITFW